MKMHSLLWSTVDTPNINTLSSLHHKSYIVLLTIVMIFFSAAIRANTDNSYFEFSVGTSQLDIDGYSKPLFKQILLGTKLNELIVEAGFLETEPFEVRSNTSNYISVKGFSLRSFKPIFLLKNLMIAPGLGAFRWDANVYRNNQKSGEDSGFSVLLFGILGYRFSDYIAIRTTASYLREVSGSNISQFSLGLLISY